MRFDRAVAEVSRLGHVNAAAAAGVMQLRCNLDREGNSQNGYPARERWAEREIGV